MSNDGRCEIIQGPVSNLPFEENSFDIVTAFETVYIWPDFVNDLKEVRRVLKDNGMMLIANEAIPKEYDTRQKHIIELLDLNFYSSDDLNESFHKAGFVDVLSFFEESRDSFSGDYADWICTIAKKKD